ncbi:LysR family transcriptional regulator [Arcobacter sp. 15-2]|uniref:LysR substrate-binding domain-containing protein n=1 Tax=Arcobacter sp. 15-2 TaxID=3374109 RepID=UPI00399CC762
MLSDFTKLNTFLTVVKEKSFSKASAKLGISQPAVTQQMRFLETYLDATIVDRKKNGISLTKEGEKLFTIAQKIEKVVLNGEKELLKIINKDITFVFGASHAIGNYILPTFLNDIKAKINNDVSVTLDSSDKSIEALQDKKIDMALIESPVFEDGIIYREWLEDEIVIFSNQKLPKRVKNEDLQSYKWVCRNPNSHTRRLFKDALEQSNMQDCETFNMVSEASSPTAIMQTILHSSKDDVPTVSIVSTHAIKEYVKHGILFESRLPEIKMHRKLYIAYLKERKHDAFIDTVINYLMTIKK